MASKYLASLTACLGRIQAVNELRWLQRQAKSQSHLADMVQRRISGSQPFGPLNLLTRPPVLIPRPETEDWVITLSNRISASKTSPKRLLDLCTGSGCIPLLLCHLLPKGSIHACGVDISEHALRLASDNAQLCGTPQPTQSNVDHENTFSVTNGNILSPTFLNDANIVPPYDIVTSNPPYIPWNEYLQLPSSVTDYEDPKALFGGPDGLSFYHAIASLVRQKRFLRPGALIALEVGHNQAEDVKQIMRSEAHMHSVEIWSDPWGKQRTVVAHLTLYPYPAFNQILPSRPKCINCQRLSMINIPNLETETILFGTIIQKHCTEIN
ncbi:hypothetical protein H0H93_008432 [Arthromyces matolae]|nr:hypothetical protein H0H93_008432 [Arthromyces matolae]